jgi:uncharacterized protein (TIGR02300 family)
VAKAEWGTKQTCPKCSTRFYDLGKDDPATCINCGHVWTPEPFLKSKQPLPYEAAKPVVVATEGEEGDLLDDADMDVEVDDESTGDVSLDDDDADLSEVVDPGMEQE